MLRIASNDCYWAECIAYKAIHIWLSDARAALYVCMVVFFSSFLSSGMESSAIHEECEAHNSRNKFLIQITRWTEMNIFILSQRYHKKCARRILNEKSKLRKKERLLNSSLIFCIAIDVAAAAAAVIIPPMDE